jgi:hypothetical protein
MSNRRVLGAAQLVLGALMLIVPRHVARATSGRGQEPPSAVVRILGGRLFVQGAVTARYPTDDVLSVGMKVDALHAVSMLLSAVTMPRYRRSALSSAAVAGGSVLAAVSARG